MLSDGLGQPSRLAMSDLPGWLPRESTAAVRSLDGVVSGQMWYMVAGHGCQVWVSAKVVYKVKSKSLRDVRRGEGRCWRDSPNDTAERLKKERENELYTSNLHPVGKDSQPILTSAESHLDLGCPDSQVISKGHTKGQHTVPAGRSSEHCSWSTHPKQKISVVDVVGTTQLPPQE